MTDPVTHPFLSACYLVSGFVMAGIYVPQVIRGWRNPLATATAQSFSSWAVWAGCRTVALLYGTLVVADPLFALAVGLDLFGRLAVLVVLLRAMWLHASSRRNETVRRVHAVTRIGERARRAAASWWAARRAVLLDEQRALEWSFRRGVPALAWGAVFAFFAYARPA